MFDKLLELWKIMEQNASIESDGFRGYSYYSDHHIETINVSNEISDLLITNGNINYVTMNKLKELGFNIFPVEKDSFGWLIGACIKKETRCGVYFE